VTPRRAATLIAVDALAHGLPVGTELREAGFAGAAAKADAGQLAAALFELDVEPEVARVAAAWPRAAKPVLDRFESLLVTSRFRLNLLQTLGYFTLVWAVQAVVGVVLDNKVLPTLELVNSQFHSPGWGDAQVVFHFLTMAVVAPVALWALLGASGWSRLPGWGRHLARAREAAVAAALQESEAPESVRAEVQRDFRQLNAPTLGQVELDAVFAEARASAERAINRFLITLRVVGLSVLTFSALGTLIAVYGSIATLARLR
jgi:hypothetical protein